MEQQFASSSEWVRTYILFPKYVFPIKQWWKVFSSWDPLTLSLNTSFVFEGTDVVSLLFLYPLWTYIMCWHQLQHCFFIYAAFSNCNSSFASVSTFSLQLNITTTHPHKRIFKVTYFWGTGWSAWLPYVLFPCDSRILFSPFAKFGWSLKPFDASLLHFIWKVSASNTMIWEFPYIPPCLEASSLETVHG